MLLATALDQADRVFANHKRQWSGLHPDFQNFMNNGEPIFPPTKDAVSLMVVAACKALKAVKRAEGARDCKNWRQYQAGQVPAGKGDGGRI